MRSRTNELTKGSSSFFVNGKYGCRIQCMQCAATSSSTNRRCTRRVCLGLPYCFQHVRRELQLDTRDAKVRVYDPATVEALGEASLRRRMEKHFGLGSDEGKSVREMRHALSRSIPVGKGLFARAKDKGSREPVFRRGATIISRYMGEHFLSEDALDSRYSDMRRGNPTVPYGMDVGSGNEYRVIDAACVRGLAAFANHSHDRRLRNAKFYHVPARGGKPPTVALKATKHIYDGDQILVSYGSQYMFSDNYKVKPDRRKRPTFRQNVVRQNMDVYV